jgi:transposase
MTTPKDRPDMSPIEVITSVQRRRRWTPEEKRALLEEAEHPGSSVSAVARKYGVNPNQMFHWRKLMREGALVAVGADDHVVPASEVKELKAQIRELERLLGKKTMEAEILRDAIRIAREKKLLLRMPLLKKDGSL